MEELIRLHAQEIAEIIMDCESIQSSEESSYTKDRAKNSAYEQIKEIVMVMK